MPGNRPAFFMELTVLTNINLDPASKTDSFSSYIDFTQVDALIFDKPKFDDGFTGILIFRSGATVRLDNKSYEAVREQMREELALMEEAKRQAGLLHDASV